LKTKREPQIKRYIVALYRVHFKWKDKEVQLTAKSLDLSHPYFVSIKELVFPKGKKLIIDPQEEDLQKAFGDTDHLMIPFQSVIIIEELSKEGKSKLMPFEKVSEQKMESSPEQ
jgi:hypothetical protein